MRVARTALWTALTLCAPYAANATPQIGAKAQAILRVEAENIGPVRLWDTTWWIDVHATGDGVALQQLDYRARFADDADSAVQSGSWELADGDSKTVIGRVNVLCGARPDYDRPLRVSLRVRDVNGVNSPWQELKFPTGAPAVSPEQQSVAVQVEPPKERRVETIGSVDVIAREDWTINEMRKELQKRAYEMGGDAAVDLKVVESDSKRLVMRATVLRYVDLPINTVATPTPGVEALQRVLGAISMNAGQR